MSLATFKKKSVVNNLGTKRSGKPPGGYWLPQGPFGNSTRRLQLAIQNYGTVGFSLNGGNRNVGGVGRDCKFSKNGTPFRGQYGYGTGGTFGKYPYSEPVYNVNRVIVMGNQHFYVKPSVLSNYGMLHKKYRWAYTGQYPHYWVQPVYSSGTQSNTASQGMYLHNLKTKNTCFLDVNDTAKYEGHCVNRGPTRICGSSASSSTATLTYNQMASNAPYTKTTTRPVDSSEYTSYVQRGCSNPTLKQKPFPYAVQTGTGMTARGTSIRKFGSSCGTGPTFTSPPEWYLKNPRINSSQSNQSSQ